MKVSELLENIRNNPDFVNNSLIVHSYDIYGGVFKFLVKISEDTSIRKKIFVEFDENEYDKDILDKTVVNWYYIEDFYV